MFPSPLNLFSSCPHFCYIEYTPLCNRPFFCYIEYTHPLWNPPYLSLNDSFVFVLFSRLCVKTTTKVTLLTMLCHCWHLLRKGSQCYGLVCTGHFCTLLPYFGQARCRMSYLWIVFRGKSTWQMLRICQTGNGKLVHGNFLQGIL